MNLTLIRKSLVAACIAVAGAGWPTGSAAQQDTTATIDADIPIGPADTNDATSRGLTAILNRSAAAYEAIETMHSAGTYHTVTKSSDEETSHLQAKITIDYQGPDRIAVHSRSDSAELEGSFIADGKTVTQIAPDEKSYLTMPQPDSLGAFCDSYRKGEIYEDKSGAMGISVIGPMLMSDDTYAILHEDISRYIYEGEEDVGGLKCHRVRFVQDDPDVVVNLWIDKEAWLIRKASFITSYDESYQRVESFEEGVMASMLIMTLDELTTDPERVNAAVFKPSIPPGYKEFEKARSKRDSEGESGFWDSMVSVAANTSPEETTWSLTTDTGKVEMRLEKLAELPASVEDFDYLHIDGTENDALAIVREDGTVSIHKADGSVSSTVSLGTSTAMFAVMHTATSGPLLLGVNDERNNLSAHNLAGKLQWEYSHPYATITGITTVSPTTTTEEAVYLTLSGKNGLRKLNANGSIAYANSRVEYSSGMKPAPPGVDRILNRGIYEIGVLDKRLKVLNTFSTDHDYPSMRWDTDNVAHPIIGVAVSSDSDILLQRLSETGDIAWTTMIAPKAEEVESSALHWANVRLGDSVIRCIAVMLSDGQVVLASPEGTVIYRGKISANEALIRRNGGNVVQNMVVADMDGDGVDEIYTRIDTFVLQLKTTP